MIGAWWRTRVFLAALLLLGLGLWGGVPPVLGALRFIEAHRHELDALTAGAERYEPLISALPPGGRIGYLPPKDWPANDSVLKFYLAEYAITPRLVVVRTDTEFVIVVPEALVDDGAGRGTMSKDSRLAGLALYAQFANGLRIFRRLQ